MLMGESRGTLCDVGHMRVFQAFNRFFACFSVAKNVISEALHVKKGKC